MRRSERARRIHSPAAWARSSALIDDDALAQGHPPHRPKPPALRRVCPAHQHEVFGDREVAKLAVKACRLAPPVAYLRQDDKQVVVAVVTHVPAGSRSKEDDAVRIELLDDPLDRRLQAAVRCSGHAVSVPRHWLAMACGEGPGCGWARRRSRRTGGTRGIGDGEVQARLLALNLGREGP